MKRVLACLCLLVVIGAARAESAWTDLWLTRDQQGQRLLDSGKPAAAARTFEDVRRRAHAEIQAGEFANAARRLEKLSDPQSQYNRGNALARSGRLENALAAYDQAIQQTTAQSALGRDARHNRELVAKQLERQASAQSKPSQHSQSAQPSQSEQNGQAQGGNQGQPQNGERNAANQSQQQERPRQAQQQQAQSDQGSKSEQSRQRQAASPQSQSSQGDSAAAEAEKKSQQAADARRDAAAALARGKQDEKGEPQGQGVERGDPTKDRNGKPAASAVDQPQSEQALAYDQWLQQIPDDPGGLLRRKFLIEHLKREQRSRQ